MIDDAKLLTQYCEERSEAAFTELVRRHLNLVYFAALRLVGGDAHLANDVTQRVFADLARKASSLKDRAVLAGWLYTSTRFAASQVVRSERRRRTHEQEAQTMQELHSAADTNWEQLRPIIDDAMGELNDRDREVVLLRFFENLPLAEVGAKFSLSPDAARMRVDRALEKLRKLLAKRGIASSSAALAAVFVTQSGLAAPNGLVAKIVSAALSKAGGGATAATMALWKILTGLSIAGLGVGLAVYETQFHRRSTALPQTPREVSDTPPGPMALVAPIAPSDLGKISGETAAPAPIARKPHRTTDDFGWPQVGLFASDAGEKPRHTVAEFMTKMSEDPDFAATVLEQAKGRLDMFYGHLFATLHLSEVKLDQFKNLLLEKQELKVDTVEAQKSLGLSPGKNPSVFHEGMARGEQRVDEEIKNLLGESLYIEYLQYREDLVQWTAVNEVHRKLTETPTPLTEEQMYKLVVLLRDSLIKTHTPYTFDLCFGAGVFSSHVGAALNERVYKRAGEFLSPPQVDALRSLQKPRVRQSQ